jgi:TRAP-type C4-dicarboxylate transport system permease small subunit
VSRERESSTAPAPQGEFVIEIADGAAQDPTELELAARKVGPLERVVRNVAGVFMTAVVVVVLIGVVARYIVNISLPWAEELARLLLVWLTFLGAAAATAQRTNLRVDTIYAQFKPGRARRVFEGFAVILSILALVVLIYAARDLFGPSAQTRSPGSGIQALWTRIALPIAAVLMIVFLGLQLRRIILGKPLDEDATPARSDEV